MGMSNVQSNSLITIVSYTKRKWRTAFNLLHGYAFVQWMYIRAYSQKFPLMTGAYGDYQIEITIIVVRKVFFSSSLLLLLPKLWKPPTAYAWYIIHRLSALPENMLHLAFFLPVSRTWSHVARVTTPSFRDDICDGYGGIIARLITRAMIKFAHTGAVCAVQGDLKLLGMYLSRSRCIGWWWWEALDIAQGQVW